MVRFFEDYEGGGEIAEKKKRNGGPFPPSGQRMDDWMSRE